MRRTIIRTALFLLAVFVVWLALSLLAATVAQLRVPVKLPLFSGASAIHDGYIKASGTWVIEGDRQAFPLQTTEITCERELKRCTSATAQVMLGEQMHVHLDTYDIVSWEKSRVVFVDEAPSCVSYVYTIDLASKSVAGVRRKKTNASGALGDCGAHDKELRLSLRSGFEVARQLQDEALPWFGQIVFAPFKLFH